MTAAAQEIVERLQGLSSEDRSEVLRFLIASLDDGVEEPGWEEAWEEELLRRRKLHEEGKGVWAPLDEIMAELREKYR